jgi:hypothetical protein
MHMYMCMLHVHVHVHVHVHHDVHVTCTCNMHMHMHMHMHMCDIQRPRAPKLGLEGREKVYHQPRTVDARPVFLRSGST